MTLDQRFAAEWAAESATSDPDLLPSALARVCARVLSFDAAGLSLHGVGDNRVPLGASDPEAAIAERLQFTHGQGPCFQAMEEGRAVLVTRDKWEQLWPVLAAEHFARTSFHAGLAVPLRAGSSRFGVLDLYTRSATSTADAATVIDAQVVASLVTTVLQEVLTSAAEGRSEQQDQHDPVGAALGGPSWLSSPAALRRQQVWVATGMTGMLLGLSNDDALSVLRAHAFVASRELDDLADDVVHHRFDLQVLQDNQLS